MMISCKITIIMSFIKRAEEYGLRGVSKGVEIMLLLSVRQESPFKISFKQQAKLT